MKKLLYFIGFGMAMALLTSCNGNNNDNNSAAACPQGTYFQNGYCMSGNGTIVQGAGYSYGPGFYADTYSGTSTLRVVNGAKLKEFFKNAMGVCDRAGGWNLGQASCDSYVGGSMDIIIQFPSSGNTNSMLATFIAQPTMNPVFNYSAQFPSGWGLLGLALGYTTGIYIGDPYQYNGVYKNPLQLEMPVSLINNSAGFQAQNYGDAWSGYFRTLIKIQVPQGKVQDSGFNFNMLIGDTPVIQGQFTRCRSYNCNLNY